MQDKNTRYIRCGKCASTFLRVEREVIQVNNDEIHEVFRVVCPICTSVVAVINPPHSCHMNIMGLVDDDEKRSRKEDLRSLHYIKKIIKRKPKLERKI